MEPGQASLKRDAFWAFTDHEGELHSPVLLLFRGVRTHPLDPGSFIQPPPAFSFCSEQVPLHEAVCKAIHAIRLPFLHAAAMKSPDTLPAAGEADSLPVEGKPVRGVFFERRPLLVCRITPSLYY